ncbi:MAG: hypothetical protein IJF40_01195 [Clostridia bacterium]|nr:hypothetical protein [Clostridia bacterium]
MKNYINRLFAGTKKWELAIWWAFRLVMIGAMISLLFRDPPSDLPRVQMFLQLFANFAAMFVWEILQLFPEKSCLRHIPAYCQTILTLGVFLASFGGAFMNFYYSISLWDTILHFTGGAGAVFFGYEIVTAMQKRDKIKCSVPIILWWALGFSFLASTAWELFEFTFDQIAGGDSQHWSYALAEAANDTKTFFPVRDPSRFALMDTMTDMVFNTIGAAVFYVFIKIWPYHHKGKNDVNEMFDDAAESKPVEKEAVTK